MNRLKHPRMWDRGEHSRLQDRDTLGYVGEATWTALFWAPSRPLALSQELTRGK